VANASGLRHRLLTMTPIQMTWVPSLMPHDYVQFDITHPCSD